MKVTDEEVSSKLTWVLVISLMCFLCRACTPSEDVFIAEEAIKVLEDVEDNMEKSKNSLPPEQKRP